MWRQAHRSTSTVRGLSILAGGRRARAVGGGHRLARRGAAVAGGGGDAGRRVDAAAARGLGRSGGARACAEALARDATVEVDASATLATLRQLAVLGPGASSRATGVGKLVGALRKHPHAAVAAAAATLGAVEGVVAADDAGGGALSPTRATA